MTLINNKTAGYGENISIKEKDYSFSLCLSPYNRRIRLITYQGIRIDLMLEKIRQLAEERDWVTKIFCKVPEKDVPVFLSAGYEKEGFIKAYFNGEDAAVVSNFTDETRKAIDPVILTAELKIMETLDYIGNTTKAPPPLPKGYWYTIARDAEHFNALALLYHRTYETYPFPIFEPRYLKETAESHIIYGLIFGPDGDLKAASSAEIDYKHGNAEMTDFATLSSERGKGLASILLKNLEDEAARRNIKCLYTLARSVSLGMNKVFKRAGYKYTGKVINNCNICGSFENMSIWCKNYT